MDLDNFKTPQKSYPEPQLKREPEQNFTRDDLIPSATSQPLLTVVGDSSARYLILTSSSNRQSYVHNHPYCI